VSLSTRGILTIYGCAYQTFSFISQTELNLVDCNVLNKTEVLSLRRDDNKTNANYYQFVNCEHNFGHFFLNTREKMENINVYNFAVDDDEEFDR
jgi:hypothetical protein